MFLIKRRYEQDGLMSWGNNQVAALCSAYRITLLELCALVGEFSKIKIRAHWRSGNWPCTMTLLFDQMAKTIARNGRPESVGVDGEHA